MLTQLNSHFTKAKREPILDVWGSLGYDKYLSSSVVKKRQDTSKMMSDVYSDLIPYINRCEFPNFVIPEIRKLGISGLAIKDFGGPGFSNLESGAILMEFTKKDASIGSFFAVHNCIGAKTIDNLGDLSQRSRILPEVIKMEKLMAFGLTEPENGSDASGLKTYATKVEGGYHINGQKRWIGNGTSADYIVIWAQFEGNV